MMMVEARRSERVRSFLRARIIFNNHSSTIDCTIKNFSRNGAKIELPNTATIPNEFDLEIPQKGRTYRARLSWRAETAVGVEFIEAEPSVHEAPRDAIQRFEAENARLRANLLQLGRRLEELGQPVSYS